jgi:DNA-binding HxlR family transcriptional regulator
MSVIAGAWTPNVIWHLRAGPRRFGELRLDAPRISAKVLSQRLKELEARGVVTTQSSL